MQQNVSPHAGQPFVTMAHKKVHCIPPTPLSNIQPFCLSWELVDRSRSEDLGEGGGGELRWGGVKGEGWGILVIALWPIPPQPPPCGKGRRHPGTATGRGGPGASADRGPRVALCRRRRPVLFNRRPWRLNGLPPGWRVAGWMGCPPPRGLHHELPVALSLPVWAVASSVNRKDC